MKEKSDKKLEVISPEIALEKFLTWFDLNKRIAFITAIVVGIITHITMMTDVVMSQDGIWNSMQYSRAGDWVIALGRWGIELAGRLNNFVAIPSITTMLCLFLMAAAAVFIVDMFGFKSKWSSLFTGMIFVVSPCLTATLLYVYTSVAYCVNMLVAILAVWFIYKFKYKKLGVLISALCFMFSLSIYQSYMGVTVGLCIMLSIIELLKDNSKIKEVFINIGRQVLAVLIGGILYYILTMVILNLTGIDMATYKGAESFGIEGIFASLGINLINTYKNFFEFFFKDNIVYNTNYRRDIWYALFYIGFVVSFIVKLVKLKADNKKEKALKIVLSSLMVLLMPLGLNIINVIAVGTEIYALTAAQMILVIPFVLALVENLEIINLVKWMIIISCICITGTYYLSDSASYSALKLTYNQAYSSTMRVFDRIETTPGYEKDMKLCLAGIIGNNNYPRTINLYGYTIGELANNTVFHGTYGGQIGTWINYMRVFFGLDIQMCDPDTYYRIVTGEDYKDMEMFPAEDSIRIIDGVVVVKLSEEPPLPY